MDITELIRLTLSMGLPCCLLALGVFLTFRILDFADMTAEGSLLIGGAACALMITKNVPPILATFVGMLAGGVCGFITGFLNRVLKIPKLLSGIITMTATASVALLIMGFTRGNTAFANLVTLQTKDNTIYSIFYNSAIRNQIIESIVMAVIVVIMITIIYFFFGTEHGMAIRATGMNEKMARAQGINTTTAKIVCVAMSNALIGLAGALWAQDARSMDVKSASGFLVVGLAAILIGETIFGKRTFKNWIISVALGGIVYYVIITIAIELGFPTQLKNLLYAVLITIALCLPLFKSLFAKLKPKKEEEKNA